VREGWDKVETEPFRDAWHIKTICDHLECVTEIAAPVKRQSLPAIRNLLINIPPRCSKSNVSSI